MEPISSKVKARVWKKTDGKCWYCGTETIPFSSERSPLLVNKDFCVDHAIPRSRGGGDELENLVPACWTCNNRKGDRTVEEFRALISQHHCLATTKETVEYRRKIVDYEDVVSRLVFYFETLQTNDESALMQGAERIVCFNDPEYTTKREERLIRRYERERGWI